MSKAGRRCPAAQAAGVLSLAVLPLSAPTVLAAEAFRPEPGIRVNTIGYLPQGAKHATVVGAASDVATFDVLARPGG